MTFDNGRGYCARLALAAAMLVAVGGFAEARPDLRTMTCDQARSTVNKSGAVVMTTGNHTYRRFVANAGHCASHETAFLTSVPTTGGNCGLMACRNRD